MTYSFKIFELIQGIFYCIAVERDRLKGSQVHVTDVRVFYGLAMPLKYKDAFE